MCEKEMCDSDVYAEVWEILSRMNAEERDRIPAEILQHLDRERNRDYVTRINHRDLFNPDNIDQRTVHFLTWLMIDYMADPQQREILIQTAKDNDRRKNGQLGETEAERTANAILWRMEHEAGDPLALCCSELWEIEDRSMVKDIFHHIQKHFDSIFYFNGKDELMVESNFLWLKFQGPVTINDRICRVPVCYGCTDPYGDVWQDIGIYWGDSLGERDLIDCIDYMCRFTETVFELDFRSDDFLLCLIDTSCDVEMSRTYSSILIGINIASAQVENFPDFYKEIILDNEADWNDIPVLSFGLVIRGKRFPLRCDSLETRYAYLSLDANEIKEDFLPSVSDLMNAKIIIDLEKDDDIQQYELPYPLYDGMLFGGYLNLQTLCDETGINLDDLMQTH